MNVVDHEAGHVIENKTHKFRWKIVEAIECEAKRQGLTTDDYIKKNISLYAISKDANGEYSELIPELNSMLQTGRRYGIIELLRKEGVI